MLPHVPLARTTPVEHLESLSRSHNCELWVKRDDLTALPYGGNKVRKLEFLLADARHRGADTLVTAGALGSHHVLATSIYGRRWGFDVDAIMIPQPLTKHVEENMRLDELVGARLHHVANWAAAAPAMVARAGTLRMEGKHPYTVAYGGSSPTGALGYVEAGLEIADQISRGEFPEPDVVVVALGSGGTTTGLALGLRAAGLMTPVIAVRVTPLLVCNRGTLAALIMGCARRLRSADSSFPPVGRQALGQIEIDGSMVGSGYGEQSAIVDAAIRTAAASGLTLDNTYTGRAFAAVLRRAETRRHRRILFWNTLNSANTSQLLAEPPPAIHN